MPVLTFRCPHCAADLKVRDADLGTSPVLCPECRKPILLSRNESGELKVAAPAPPSAAQNAKKQKPIASGKPPAIVPEKTPAPLASATAGDQSSRPAFSRQAMFWTGGSLAGIVVAVLAGIFFWPRASQSGADAVKADVPVATNPRTLEHSSIAAVTSPKKGQPADAAKKAAAATAASRLTELGERIGRYRSQQGHFPSSAAPGRDALQPSEQLSWMAELVATVLMPNRPAPSRTDSWRSPHNERFVRQQIPEFLNPSISQLTGAENYPTTHFVGVAGVGADAVDLSVGHPRAGIFGNGRNTRLEDIRDGASNTLMIVGVTKDLGSWAAAGTPTVRAFTREPYVNGPDGLGTGSPDRMLVLKADGSVQEMSAKTDPRIFRRMAAMADGLPLDPKVPGEPGEKSPTPVPDRLAATAQRDHAGLKSAGAPPNPAAGPQKPVAAVPPVAKNSVKPPAPPPRKIDLNATLGQRVERYEQIKPVPLREVLNTLEEMVSVPIRGDRHEIADLDDLLQTPVTFSFEKTTVRAILDAVLAQAQLTYQVQADAIQLHKIGGPGRSDAP
jgi:hypothetical protein